MNEKLFTSYKLGRIELKNRVVMAPMTRSRAIGNIANDLMAKYYAQRASAGLLITEGVSPSVNGLGYARIPGLFNSAQVQGWKLVTNEVHKIGGRIFVQLMHCGRAAHPANLPSGGKIMAPSAIAAQGEMWTDSEGMKPYPLPAEMTEAEIQSTLQEYVQSAKMAIEAGFDGVELHGANGYLIDQFLNTASNQRKDRWGGSIENRMRFALELARLVSAAIGADRVGFRVSPYGAFNGMTPDSEMDALYEKLSHELGQLGLCYIHVVDHSSMGAPTVSPEVKKKIRDGFKGTTILSGGYDLPKAEEDLMASKGELVAFGRPFIANPNLVDKFKNRQSLNQPDANTFYTPGEKGYTDYT